MSEEADRLDTNGDLKVEANLSVAGSSYVFGSARFSGPLTVAGDGGRVGVGLEQPMASMHLRGGGGAKADPAGGDLMIGQEGQHLKLGTRAGTAAVDASTSLILSVDRRPQLQLTSSRVQVQTSLTTPSAVISRDLSVGGRLHTRAGRTMTMARNRIATRSTTYTDLMSARLATTGNPVLIMFHTGGVQPSTPFAKARLYYRLHVDNRELTYSVNEFHNGGYELRDVSLQWLGTLAAGVHSIKVQWRTEDSSYQNNCCWGRNTRSLIAAEF